MEDAPREGASHERRRVLWLSTLTIAPPLALLVVLAVVAARNDEVALRFVHDERTRQAAARARDALQAALARAEEEVFARVDPVRWSSPSPRADELEATFAAAGAEHPIARRFLAVGLDGQLLWPDPRRPFGARRDLLGAPAEEPVGDSVAAYRRRAELLAAYDRAAKAEDTERLAQAAAGFAAVASAADATPTLVARAAYRHGRIAEALGRASEAVAAYDRAAAIAVPVRDERGRPVRVLATLRAAELVQDGGDPAAAAERASSLLRVLLAGDRHDDLDQEEWEEALERARAALAAAGQREEAAAAAAEVDLVLRRLEWADEALTLAPALIDEATSARAGDVRHHARVAEPPVVLAHRLFPGAPGATGPVVVAFELDLDRLVSDVLAPAARTLDGEEPAAVALVDGAGRALLRAGVLADKDRRRDDEAASTPFGAVPLWAVEARISSEPLHQARRNRLVLYGGLLLLTVGTAAAGTAAMVRFVERSLELAKLKSDFLSNITHELKTPLTSIKMYGELLAMGRARDPERQKEYAEQIVREGSRLQKLIEDVLDFARQDAGRHEYVLAEEDVADTVAEALDLFRHSAKVRGFDLYVELPPVGALPPVDLDRDAIVRSVLNLLSNAVKYSGDGRWLRVSVAREERDHVAIAVEDKGIGIDEADLERIFDRFYRAGDELTRGVSGAGLGLSLIDQIVQAHGGEIRVESQRGAGSTFTILLPIVEDYREQWPPPAPSDEGEVELEGEPPDE